jgi:hypothetical protein
LFDWVARSRHQASAIAGTVVHGTHLQLRIYSSPDGAADFETEAR